MESKMNKSTLTIVGSGIKFFAHLTSEVKSVIAQSDKVLYLVNDPLIEEWLKENNPKSESLEFLYGANTYRLESYKKITMHILNVLKKTTHLCVVLYGHPSVFAQPALDAVINAKKEGFNTQVLPGISAEDCLFADLYIDPGEYGCQSFEATDFLIRPRQFDNSCHLILWQIGSIGLLGFEKTHHYDVAINLLVEVLSNYYSLNHEVIIYEAAQYPMFLPRIQRVLLSKLPLIKLNSTSTLYVPPFIKAKFDMQVMEKLGICVEHLI